MTVHQEKIRKFPLFHPLSRRLHIVLLCMVGFFCTTFMRIHLSLTMTCMMNSTALAIESEAHSPANSSLLQDVELVSDGKCGSSDDGHKKVVVDYGGELVWSSHEQNLIFSGTFWGAIVTVLPSMFFIERFSTRHVLQVAVAVYILITAITPYLATNFGYFPVFVARVIMGLGEGFIIPANNQIIGAWFPSSEKSTAISLFTTGNQIASAGGSPVVAALCASSLGWPVIFYFASVIGMAWSVMWFFVASNHPSKAKIMDPREREYLLANVAKGVSKTKKKSRSVPYAKILTSPAFLGQLQCHFVVNVIMTLFQIYLPSYFKEVLHLGVIANGTYASIPNIFNMAFKMVWGIGIDKMKERKTVSNTTAVKISHGIGAYGSALSLFLIAFFVDCSNPTTGLVFFCLMYCCMATFVSGFYTSLLCMAPQYTATMSSISMFCAMMGRLSTPAIVSIFRTQGTASEWQNIFLGCAVAHIISGSIFVIFGSGDVQEWGKTEEETEMTAEKEALSTEFVFEEEEKNEISARLVREDSLCL